MLALKSAGIKGKVIVPSFTFCATAHAVVWAGLEPVFVDIDPETFNLDPAKVRAAITPEVKAILAVHVFGNPCAIDELAALAKEHNLALFFDAAHAFGSTYKKQKIGSFGLAETFSTHATKPFMAVEGGIISTKDQVLLEHLQKSRNFGVDSPIDTAFIGTNAKMSELHALVGLDSLSYYPANLNKRKELVRSYQEKLRDLPGLRFQKIQENSQSSYFFFSIVLDPVKFGANRDELAVALEQAGVQTRKYFYLPLHQQKSYKGYVTGCLPHTEAVASNILCLPTHTELTFDDVSYICDIIKKLQSEKKPAVSPAQLSESKNELFSSYSYLSDDNIKRVLVTGGAGYVGCVLVKKLLEKGYQVRVLDKLIFGKEPLAEFANNPNFNLQVGPVEDKYILEKCLKGVDAVIHLVGLSNDPSCEIDSELTRKENIEATKILLEMCKGRSVKRFIFASSCSVYGFTGDIVVTEESIPNPLTAYARSKIDCEKLILPAADKNFTTVCLRKATIYGPSPRMRFDLVINAMTGTALSEGKITINGGEQWRPHLHVEDAAEVYLFMLEAEKAKISGQVFNIGSNHQNIKIADLAKRISRIIPNASVEQSDNPDKRSYNACFDKINSLGWKAQRDVEDGVLGVKKLFDEGHIKDFRDLNYFNIKRLYTYLNI